METASELTVVCRGQEMAAQCFSASEALGERLLSSSVGLLMPGNFVQIK